LRPLRLVDTEDPKYFRPMLVKYIGSILQDKVMFGSDFPVLQPTFSAIRSKWQIL
jgi:predicted TIM-barrel fold metal-dependent hydrolase